MAVLIDTSGLYALLDSSDAGYQATRRWVAGNEEPLILPVTVLPEVDYLILKRLTPRVEVSLFKSILAGEFQLENFLERDLARAVALVEQYAGSDLGLVDASVAAIAERLNVRQVLTLDRRHIGMLRPRHCAAFDLVP